MVTLTRAEVLRFRFVRHQLDRSPVTAAGPLDVDLLDYGVQDTGTGGAAWALEVRGAPPADAADLLLAWTLRGAPHAYRRVDAPAVALATSPFSEADAASRVFDAAKPLRAAGIPVLEALRTVADHLRELAARPIVKGDASGALNALLGEPYLRHCRPCAAVHIHEQPFRLAALQAGLELEPATSPPVLRRIPKLRPLRFERTGAAADGRFHVIRNHLRFYGPATVKQVATFLDAPVADVRAWWPGDAVEVTVTDAPADNKSDRRFVLADDVAVVASGAGASAAGVVRLLGPYDPYLQLRDRELLVPDAARRKDLWRVLGRPGAVVVDGEVVGTWRPRASGRKLVVAFEEWGRWPATVRRAAGVEAERLAAHRGLALG